MAPDFEERVCLARSVEDEVLQFALGKAESVASRHPGAVVIGADTVVVLDGIRFGKPADMDDAKKTLSALSGKTHLILTSVAVSDGAGEAGFQHLEKVLVKMRPFSADEIDRYLSRNESMDKAGAYSIQGHGRALIESISGDYLAAVGMPLRQLAGYLESRGIALPIAVDDLYQEKRFLNWRSFF